MIRKLYGLGAKIAIFVLTIFMVLVLAMSLVGAVYLTTEDAYSDSVNSYFDTSSFQSITNMYAHDAVGLFMSGEQVQPGSMLSEGRTNFSYRIVKKDNENEVLTYNYVATGDTYMQVWTHEALDEEGALMVISVQKDFPIQDHYASSHTLFNWLYPLRNVLLATGVAGGLLALVGLVLLLCTMGHRKGSEEIHLRGVDKIPFDLLLVCSAVAGFVVLNFFVEHVLWSGFFGYSIVLTALSIGMFVTVSASAGIGLLMTFATRVKNGGWWRNTIVWYVLQFCWRVLRWFGRIGLVVLNNIPVLWKLVLGFCGALFVDVLLAIWFFDWFSAAAFFFGVVYNLALVACVCYIGLCLHRLKQGAKRLAEGDLAHVIDTKGLVLDFRQHAEALNSLRDGMRQAVEQQIKSERLKTELITNVSHDIKTPLTSIVNYVDLLQHTNEPAEREEYLEVLGRQTQRLKKLTEDLVEASKASTGNIAVNLAQTDLGELVTQAVGEYAERFGTAGLEVLVSLPEEKAIAIADGRHMWRVLDNLLGNIGKYAMPGTRVYLQVYQQGNDACIVMKNISAQPLGSEANELMERFVRGDTSRNTEGSGLGLSIVQSLVQLQNGTLQLSTDGDLFKATICLPGAESNPSF